MGVIFAKTPRGQDEITSRAGGLSPRVRRVLIFVDGKRTVDELRGMLQSDDLQHTLGVLEESGYIELLSVIDPQGKAQRPSTPLPALNAFRPLPSIPDPLEQQQAKNFMLNTLSTYVGRVGTSSLLDRIEAVEDAAGLRELFDEWYHTIVMSRDGRREAEGLRSRLLKVL